MLTTALVGLFSYLNHSGAPPVIQSRSAPSQSDHHPALPLSSLSTAPPPLSAPPSAPPSAAAVFLFPSFGTPSTILATVVDPATPLPDDRLSQMQGLVQRFGEQIAHTQFSWVSSPRPEWLPVIKPKSSSRMSIREVYDEWKGLRDRIGLEAVELTWAARWRVNQKTIKNELSIRRKIIAFVNDAVRQSRVQSPFRVQQFLEQEYTINRGLHARAFAEHISCAASYDAVLALLFTRITKRPRLSS